jgi:hypothetical protein
MTACAPEHRVKVLFSCEHQAGTLALRGALEVHLP